MTPHREYKRLGLWFGAATAVAGLLTVALALQHETLAVPLTRWRLPWTVLASWGGGVAASGLLLAKASPRWSLAAGAVAWTALVALALGWRAPRRGDQLLDVFAPPPPTEAVAAEPPPGVERPKLHRFYVRDGEWQDLFYDVSPQRGSIGIPWAQGRHHASEFDVAYHLDGRGCRVMPPTPPNRQGVVTCLGDSNTFGIGVNDHETFAYLLAQHAWRQVEVRNLSLPGWGTTNACQALEETLSSDDPPDAVLYGWISHHLSRNYLRRSWHHAASRWFPFYELVDDDAVYQGIRSAHDDPTWEDGPELREREVQISLAMLRSMHRQCALAGVKFVVLALICTSDDPVPRQLLGEGEVPVVDLNSVSSDRYGEGHPTWRWHRAVARALAGNAVLADLLGLPGLYQPDAIAPPPVTWRLDVNWAVGAVGHLEFPAGENVSPGAAPLRVKAVVRAVPTATNPYCVQLQRPQIELAAGVRYRLSLRARAAPARTLALNLVGPAPDWKNAGLSAKVECGPDWRDYRWTFTPARSEERAALSLAIGDAEGEVELEQVRLEEARE